VNGIQTNAGSLELGRGKELENFGEDKSTCESVDVQEDVGQKEGRGKQSTIPKLLPKGKKLAGKQLEKVFGSIIE